MTATKAKVIDLLPCGLSKREIARRAGCSYTYVNWVIENTGLPHVAPAHFKPEDFCLAEMRRLARAGHSGNEARRQLGMSCERFTRLMKLPEMADVVWLPRGATNECLRAQKSAKDHTGLALGPYAKRKKKRCKRKKKTPAGSSPAGAE